MTIYTTKDGEALGARPEGHEPARFETAGRADVMPGSDCPWGVCAACRAAAACHGSSAAPSAVGDQSPVCLTCYRAGLARSRRALAAARRLVAPSLQVSLPFEPVNWHRLARLKAERLEARRASGSGLGRYADRRRSAQISARHALEAIARGLRDRQLRSPRPARVASALRRVELPLRDQGLPLVSAR